MSLKSKGVQSVRLDEIVDEYYDGKLYTKSMLDDVQRLLPLLKKHINEKYGRLVVLVNEAHFFQFRRIVPLEIAEAERHLPIGHGVRAFGIHFATTSDDTILLAQMGQDSRSTTGKGKKLFDRTTTAVQDGQLSLLQAGRLADDFERLIAPDNPMVLAQAKLAFLGPPSKDDDEDELVIEASEVLAIEPPNDNGDEPEVYLEEESDE